MKLMAVIFLLMVAVITEAQNGEIENEKSYIEKVYQGNSQSESPASAKKEIIDNAIEVVSNELIIASIGREKFNRNKNLILQKIVKQSGKYIPNLKTGDVQRQGDGYKLAVYLQVNTKILEALLLQNGLLYAAEGAPVILPLIRIVDRKEGRAFAWWMQKEDSGLAPHAKVLENLLQNSFFDSEFYGIKPSQSLYGNLIPDFFRKEKFSVEDLQALASQINVQVILTGELVFIPASSGTTVEAELKMSGYQSSNGKLLAEMVRRFNMDRASYESVSRRFIAQIDPLVRDFSGQILEAWKRGTFGASTARIVVVGGLPINKLEKLKLALGQSSKSIRQIRERLVSQDSVVFEVEVVAPLESIAGDFKDLNIGDGPWKVSEVGIDSLTLRKF